MQAYVVEGMWAEILWGVNMLRAKEWSNVGVDGNSVSVFVCLVTKSSHP